MKIFFLIFLIVPLIEIFFLIKISSVIGAVITIFLIIFTAVFGAYLVRAQGVSTLSEVLIQLGKGVLPAVEMIEGLCLFIAGALLLAPGFFTDAIGFILLTPTLRRALIVKALEKKLFVCVKGHSISSTHYEQQGFKSFSKDQIIDYYEDQD